MTAAGAAQKIRVVRGLPLHQIAGGWEWRQGKVRFEFNEGDRSWVLRGPHRDPEGFSSLKAAVAVAYADHWRH